MRTRHHVPARPRMAALVAASVASVVSIACGHRGDPRPPVYPEPPPVQGLEVDQRGVEAVLRFPLPGRTAEVGGEEVELESLEVMVLTERYPVLDAGVLIAALEQRRDLMVEQARLEEQRRLERERREAAEEAGEEPPPATETPVTPGAARNEDEDLLRRIPPETLEEWRRAGLSRESMLHAAGQLRQAVQTLWSRLGQPTTVLDPAVPPRLPDPAVAAREAPPILGGIEYGRQISWEEFVGRAAARYRFDYDDAEEYRVGDMLQVVDLMGASPGDYRTRYYYAVRGRSARGRPGQVRNVVELLPEAVPVAPPGLRAEVVPTGVDLAWQPPGDDTHLRRVDPDTLGYNVYRALAGEPFPARPLNQAPLTEPSHSDTNLTWDRRLRYEVRAVILPVQGPVLHEGEGARTGELDVFDDFPPAPPEELTVLRTGDTVTVQWTASPAPDRRGYRVYRHALPAPELPDRGGTGWVLPREFRQPPAGEAGGTGAPGGDATTAGGVGEAGEPENPAGAAGQAGGQAPQDEPQAPQEEPANPMVDAGWALLTPEPISRSRYTDPDAEAGVAWAYAVETVDARGNLSVLVYAEEEGRR